MTITIKQSPKPDDKPIEVYSNDAALIKDIRDKCGLLSAIRVTRWLTKGDLKVCKDFVESL